MIHVRFRLTLACLLLVLLAGCPAKDRGTLVFKDDFNRAELGPGWRIEGGQWAIEDGRVVSPRAENRNLWLLRDLPRDVRIEFDARSASPDVDIKFVVFGDGETHETGYVCILGGWKNTISIIARMHEHGSDRLEKRDNTSATDTDYHMTVIRRGNRLTWKVNGKVYLEYDDPQPLSGEYHSRFGFSNWRSQLSFDNLEIHQL